MATFLKKIRQEYDVSQEFLAEKIGVSQAKISNALAAIGKGKKYSAPKETAKTKQAEKKVARAQSVILSADSLPDGMVVRLYKEKLNIGFEFIFKTQKHAKTFNMKQELVAVVKQINANELLKEMNVLRKEL